MNVDFPFARTVHAFWVTIAIMVALLVGMLAYFRHRRWL
jgi:Mg2+ and Co2+ transporter CorA